MNERGALQSEVGWGSKLILPTNCHATKTQKKSTEGNRTLTTGLPQREETYGNNNTAARLSTGTMNLGLNKWWPNEIKIERGKRHNNITPWSRK
jgi:hypothetical protein